MLETSSIKPNVLDDPIFCNVWNWYDGPAEDYKGSSIIIFYGMESRKNAILGITTDEDSVPAIMEVVSGRRAQLTANSEPCFKLARQCIKNCLNGHSSSCPFDDAASLPTRVIDLGLDMDAPKVRVFETKGLQGIWVALSHCWGRIARFVTETSNLDERTQGIALADLPNTFLDAIKITRKLGYRYLWIDSLCILQDSHQYWVDEWGRMQDYYSKAILTIASDLATGDHESFLDNARPESTSITIPFNTKVTLTRQSHVYISKDVQIPGTNPDETSLSVPGWTLQEDILSPRSLHYTTIELVFECQQCRFIETDLTPRGYNEVDQLRASKRFFLRPTSGFNDPFLVKYPTHKAYYQPISRWYRLFENYCTRLLTYESDRLAAIAGLAKETQRQTNFSYKAGLWAEDIHTGLLWGVNGRGERVAKYQAPSWSWASLDIRFHRGRNINPRFELYMSIGNWDIDSNPESYRRAEVLGCEVEPTNGNTFRPVVGGRLRLRGYMLPLAEWKGSTETYINVYWRMPRSHQQGDFVGAIRAVKAADQLVCDFDLTPED
ncbi:hypothetical protein LSUB1_G005400 [Lachnellula subtilissima]|uniref:Heterokaryon incompatibility domain-containing protein n=1 Tax=Lachnellula subtilissima TaxID=602034 RepID=A0A8H8RVH2_9HELO|nr:hypothetical protein LSUB1_G005400 [Lachnellula subtilissima]